MFSVPGKLDLQFFEQSGQWELLKPVTYELAQRAFKDSDYFQYDTVVFTFRFRRLPSFYVNVILLPSALMGMLSILCFLLPVESGEKVSLGITVLLSQQFELLVLSEILPPTSGNFPIAVRFIIFNIVLISISVVDAVIVSRVHFTHPENNFPDFMKRLLNSWVMGKLLLNKLDKICGKNGKVCRF